MDVWLWGAVGILVLIIIALLIKIYLLQKAAREINEAFADRLMTDTNTLIDISSNDKYMRRLAHDINVQLRKLQRERNRFVQGDLELKSAVTNISHDLRTPLTAICGYLDLIEQKDKSGEICRYVAIIQNRVAVLKQLTEELFRYSIVLTVESDKSKEPVVVNDILEESIAAFYTALKEKKIIPNIQMPENKVVRSLDRAALSRVFSNLLYNAVKYSDGDLDITLSAQGEIFFSNTATSLNKVQVAKLFDRFYTVEAARNSTGLGLAISRHLIEQMGGTISATYENNRLNICTFLPNTDS